MRIPNYFKKKETEPEVPKDAKDNNPMEIIEDALVICKFGRFHYLLLFTSLTSVLATSSVTTAVSYVLPSAECDLNMNLMEKGLLNAIPFLGQLCVSFFTGFIVDTFGRRLSLITGSLGMFVFTIFGGSSQTYGMIMFVKLAEGVCMSLSFTATATLVSEFTPRGIRDRVLLTYASFMSMAIIIVSLLGWGLLPRPWHFVLVKGYFEIHSWNIYLYASGIWSLLATVLYWQLPESPKFLLLHGRESEALEVLRKVYKINTGKDKDTFPISSLYKAGSQKIIRQTSLSKQITDSLKDVKDLFRKPLLYRLILFSTCTFVCLLVYSALRLWFPQLSTIIETYSKDNNGSTAKFCVIMDDYNSRNAVNNSAASAVLDTGICVPKIAESETYTNGILLGVVSLVCISASAYLVALVGQKPLMSGFLLLCAVCSVSLYWSNRSIQIAILISAICGFMQAAFSLQHNIIVRVFPTSVRTLALSLVLMIGRIGSLIGNILFPVMLEKGCMIPFLSLAIITLSVGGLVFFMPDPNKENNGTGDK